MLFSPIFSPSANASFYLRADAKDWRCEWIGKWVDGISEQLDNIQDYSASGLAEKTAFGFHPSYFSGFIGRGYDDLTNSHLKRMRKDLDKCQFRDGALAKALKEPLDPRRALKSSSGQVWLNAIYGKYDEVPRQRIATMFDSLSGQVSYGCRADKLIDFLGTEFQDPELVKNVNPTLSQLNKSQAIMGNSNGRYAIGRRIKDLDFALQLVQAQPRRFKAPEIYKRILSTERTEIAAFLEPPDEAAALGRYVDAHLAWFDDAARRIEAASNDFWTWRRLNAFEFGIQKNYKENCFEVNPTLKTFSLSKHDADRLEEGFQNLRQRTIAKLEHILTTDENVFRWEIRHLRSLDQLRKFFDTMIVPFSAGQQALGRSRVLDEYRDRYRRVEDHLALVEELIKTTERRIQLEGRLALMTRSDGWHHAADEKNGDKFVMNVLREALFSENATLDNLGGVFERNDPGRTIQVAFYNSEIDGSTVQLVLKCDRDGNSGGIEAYASVFGANDWTSQERVSGTEFRNGSSKGNARDFPTNTRGRVNYTNSLSLSVPVQPGASVRWEIPLTADGRVYKSPLLASNTGVVADMTDACFPHVRREATLLMPVLE